VPRRLALALVVLGTLAPSVAQAGAWTQSEGRCYAKLGARAILGSGAYEATGLRDARQGIVDYFDLQLGLYAECGLHDRFTAVLYGAPFGYAVADDDTFYVGPIGGAVRFDPLGDGGPTRLAFQLDYAYAPPVGDVALFDEPGASPRVIYQPALENHYGELTVQLGHGFSLDPNVSGWVQGSVGARLNSADSMDPALTALASVGFTFYGWFQVEAYFPFYEPFGQDVTVTNIAGVGQTRYLGFGARVSAWMVEQLAIYAAIDGVFYASSNAATPAIQLGLESRFRAWGEPD